LIFSAGPFPGYNLRVKWQRAEMSGNMYYSEELAREGWLCPALLKHFEKPPAELYAKFGALAPSNLA
jgi:hypothetical protein